MYVSVTHKEENSLLAMMSSLCCAVLAYSPPRPTICCK